jgi:hypothetical protein
LAEIENLHDTRMTQPSRRTRLLQKAFSEIGPAHKLRSQDLDSYVPLQHFVETAQDEAHAPLANKRTDTVTADLLSD